MRLFGLTFSASALTFLTLSFAGCAPSKTPIDETAGSAAMGEATQSDGNTAAPQGDMMAEVIVPEKEQLKLGFIKLTDCASLVIAKEKGFFADEGLNVELEAQTNWKVLLDGVIGGQLDGAHMLSGQPIGATIGYGTQTNIITAFSMDLNGNGITVSNSVWKAMQEANPELNSPTPPHPISAKALKPVIEKYKSESKVFNMGMVFPVSTHNYELRYWLAAAELNPGMYTPSETAGTVGADVVLSVTPPPQMPSTLEAGTIDGFCVGEPWNEGAVAKDIGVAVCTNYEIWKNNPEKVFGVTEEWNNKYPSTHVAVVKAMIRAGKWLDETNSDGGFKNREEAVEILARPNYVGADKAVIANSMTGFFYYQKSDKVAMPDFNVFYKYNATYPYYSDCVWFLTQMRRWGQINEPKDAVWYAETAKKVYRPDIYRRAATSLVDDGLIESSEVPWDTDGYKPPTSDFIDGKMYDGKKPVEYLKSFAIGNKD